MAIDTMTPVMLGRERDLKGAIMAR